MKRLVIIVAATVALMSPTTALAKRATKPDPALEAMAACAAEKNAGDVFWAYILQSGQSGLEARVGDGANAMALFLMARDCAPAGVRFDNKHAMAFSDRAVALWGGDKGRQSTTRPIDAWADCLADRETARARGFLFARDAGFAGGPKFVVNGVDPIEGVLAASVVCDELRPADRGSINMTDFYARLNYRLRVQPRLAAVPASAIATNEKN